MPKEKTILETQIAGGQFEELPYDFLSAVLGDDNGIKKVAIAIKKGDRVAFLTMTPKIAEKLALDLQLMVKKSKEKVKKRA